MNPDLSNCAIHTMTTKPWSLVECCEHYAAAGVGGISIWRNTVAPEEGGVGLDEAANIMKASGLAVPAYVRGGFFPAFDGADRQKAIDHNKVMLDEAAALDADQVVLVVGAVPGMPLNEARQQTADGIAACLEHAEQVGVKLSIEPLHPMYAGDKSCVNRMAEAREICEMQAIFLHDDTQYTAFTPLEPLLIFASRQAAGSTELVDPDDFQKMRSQLEDKVFDVLD